MPRTKKPPSKFHQNYLAIYYLLEVLKYDFSRFMKPPEKAKFTGPDGQVIRTYGLAERDALIEKQLQWLRTMMGTDDPYAFKQEMEKLTKPFPKTPKLVALTYESALKGVLPHRAMDLTMLEHGMTKPAVKKALQRYRRARKLSSPK